MSGGAAIDEGETWRLQPFAISLHNPAPMFYTSNRHLSL